MGGWGGAVEVPVDRRPICEEISAARAAKRARLELTDRQKQLVKHDEERGVEIKAARAAKRARAELTERQNQLLNSLNHSQWPYRLLQILGGVVPDQFANLIPAIKRQLLSGTLAIMVNMDQIIQPGQNDGTHARATAWPSYLRLMGEAVLRNGKDPWRYRYKFSISVLKNY